MARASSVSSGSSGLEISVRSSSLGCKSTLPNSVLTRFLGFRTVPTAEVERCMDIGKECPGFFMAVGNHIPSNTPVKNALYYNEVYEELSVR